MLSEPDCTASAEGSTDVDHADQLIRMRIRSRHVEYSEYISSGDEVHSVPSSKKAPESDDFVRHCVRSEMHSHRYLSGRASEAEEAKDLAISRTDADIDPLTHWILPRRSVSAAK